ncbi:hypothetical protein RND81_11G104100 [Saponaria officinalis]|uniref:Phytocyanin domain-containing protein n=1 Tax=Saponaria officinalis TaxID=3572 RepID=A0AAW1HKA6_SAPOF
MLFLSSSQGYKFYVGGKDGWVLNPSESYSHWAGRNRFQVNDTLLFKLKKGEDSVLIVTKDNYNECNVNNPISSLSNEESVYTFTRSGPHYFISSNTDHCNKGQKILIVVLAIRPKNPPPPSSSGPSPPPPSEPVSPTPSPTPSTEDGSSPPSQKNNNSSGVSLKSPLMGVVLSVVVGVSVVLVGWSS